MPLQSVTEKNLPFNFRDTIEWYLSAEYPALGVSNFLQRMINPNYFT